MKRFISACAIAALGVGLAAFGAAAPASADDIPTAQASAAAANSSSADTRSADTASAESAAAPAAPADTISPPASSEPGSATGNATASATDPPVPSGPVVAPTTGPATDAPGAVTESPESGTPESAPAAAGPQLTARVATVASAIVALAVPPSYPVVKKITFCHKTGSDSNPYVRLTTSVNAFFHAGHDTHQDFGDIVPPFSYEKPQGYFDFDGLNYDADAQTFIDNGCSDVPPAPGVATASVVVTDADCGVAQELILGATIGTNASWGAYTDLEGPLAGYTVVSTADKGSLFAPGPGVSMDRTTQTFGGSLAGPLGAETGRCLAAPIVSSTPITCTGGGSFTIGGDNVDWTVNSEPTPAGTYPVTAATTIELAATAVAPFSIDPDPTLASLPFTAPTGCAHPSSSSTPTSLATTGTDPSGFIAGAAVLLLLGAGAMSVARRRHA